MAGCSGVRSQVLTAMSLMVSASKYEPCWQDLQRRNLLVWFVAISFVPGVLLLIVAANVWLGDVPKYFGRWVGGCWIAAFALVGIYRRRFQCPRCQQRFFGRGSAESTKKCAHCDLPLWAQGDPRSKR
jgi:hypothetical protein